MADVRLRVIVGPTAAGKSAIALALARQTGGAIISADSRQIYRGFDIGTAKPSPNEQKEILHFGIDVASPTERYSAARFAALAREAIARCRSEGREVVVVGGTGFYIGALVEPLFPEPELDPSRRAQLNRYLASLETETLRRWCARLDPARSSLGRTQLLRALEVALLTGRTLSSQFQLPTEHTAVTARYLIIDPDTALTKAIERRVDAMFEGGWLDEVRSLAAAIPPTAPAWNATGYETLRRYVAGDDTLDFASVRNRIIQATRQYAKRQRTWFRHQLKGDMQRLDPNEPEAFEQALAWWRKESQ